MKYRAPQLKTTDHPDLAFASSI